jgi:hypothetical protein
MRLLKLAKPILVAARVHTIVKSQGVLQPPTNKDPQPYQRCHNDKAEDLGDIIDKKQRVAIFNGK